MKVGRFIPRMDIKAPGMERSIIARVDSLWPEVSPLRQSRGQCPLWVKSGNSHREYVSSALRSKADIIADML
jgi:hypothetical protein